MHKRYYFITGLILLCVGGGMLWWVLSETQKERREAETLRAKYSSETSEYIKRYEDWLQLPPEERTVLPWGLDENGETKSHEQIQQEQQERLKADMDKLAAGEMAVYPFADDFYGENWQAQLVEYKKQKEFREFIFTTSIVCTSFGGLIVGWFLLIGIIRLIIKIVSGFFSIFKRIFRLKKKSYSEPEATEEANEEESDSKNITEIKINDAPPEEQKEFEELPKVLVNSHWQYQGFDKGKSKTLRQKKDNLIKSESAVDDQKEETPKGKFARRPIPKQEKNEQLSTPKSGIHHEKVSRHEQVPSQKADHSPIDSTLKDLSKQVSAIREYAANQQDRLRKLQDGYDWNIIKTFCLRIIRCIDNLECRIERMLEQDGDTTDLEEVRDELVFALESSGVEQFEPKINSEYRGQEKYAEAVKEKKKSEVPEQKGKIEKIIRPGYQCFIDEENVRIVRPAQVRLFA
jgi:molecular chaperone GrpE (heat shock protein)